MPSKKPKQKTAAKSAVKPAPKNKTSTKSTESPRQKDDLLSKEFPDAAAFAQEYVRGLLENLAHLVEKQPDEHRDEAPIRVLKGFFIKEDGDLRVGFVREGDVYQSIQDLVFEEIINGERV